MESTIKAILILNVSSDSSLTRVQKASNGILKAANWPDGLTVTTYAGPELTPSPACLAVRPQAKYMLV
jgi:hypothetical protein